jgi:glycosyltransferase involved in cell wall biosynthesis
MKQSITYNLTTKFHKKIVERLLPLNTKRRKYYNLGLSGSRLLVNEGWDRLWWCYRERKQPLPSGLDHSIPISLPKENRQKVDNLPVIQKKISVIIPTKNAGDDFSFTLEKIQNQKGMQNIEIIIVDSGSTDNTLSLAEKYGARIITILPEEFNHGKTRNLGASNADGDYILFMVQDAIPVGGYCIYNMIKFLESDRSITAASCRQIPRSDADFFTCYLLWNHNRVLGFNSDKITTIVDNFENLSPLEKRKIAGIDNVFCLFRADIFKKMMFNSREYAEDLDLGLRLIQKGYSLGFVYSTAIIHSHNRNPEYFFRRAFVDTLELSILLGKEKNFNHNDRVFETVFGNIITMSFIIQKSIDESLETGPVTLSENAMNFFKNRLQLNYNTFSEGSHVHSLKRTTCFNEIFQRCMTICYPKLIVPDEDIFNSYVQLLDSFYDYLKTFPSIESRDDEFYNSLLKLFAIYAGSNLANAYLKDRSVDSDKKMLIKKTIYEGI